MDADAGDAEEFARTRLDAAPVRVPDLRQRAEAEDLAQIAVIEVWRRWATAGSNPDAYARRVIVSRNVSRWRRWRHEVPGGGWRAERAEGRRSDGPGATARRRPGPRSGQRPDAVAALPAAQTGADRGRAARGVPYTFDEIAAMSGEPRGTVASRYTRGLQTLREQLHAQNEAARDEAGPAPGRLARVAL